MMKTISTPAPEKTSYNFPSAFKYCFGVTVDVVQLSGLAFSAKDRV